MSSLATRFSSTGGGVFSIPQAATLAAIFTAQTRCVWVNGEQVLQNVDIAVLDFRPRGGVDGLLGMNVLRHYRFEIDQDRDVLRLQRR